MVHARADSDPEAGAYRASDCTVPPSVKSGYLRTQHAVLYDVTSQAPVDQRSDLIQAVQQSRETGR